MAPAGETLIELTGICRDFDDGAVTALRDINLAIQQGEFVAVVGPSGSGKSSLLHIMAGIDRPSEGSTLWRGKPVDDQSVWTGLRRTQIGLVFQEFLLLPTLTALENVAVAMSGTRVSAAEQTARAKELLASVGLSHRLNHLPQALSGGERQRVAVARAIANGPKLLLCDEPTGNLDSAASEAVVDLLLSLCKTQDVTLVLVTHDAALAGLAERRIVIRDGRIVGGAEGRA